MTEDQKVQLISTDLAVVKSELSHLNKSFDEYKVENKEYHTQQATLNEKNSQTLDTLTLEIQKMGGLYQGFTSLQGQINVSQKWIDENREFIADLKEDKKDTHKKIKAIAYKYSVEIGLAITASYLYLQK